MSWTWGPEISLMAASGAGWGIFVCMGRCGHMLRWLIGAMGTVGCHLQRFNLSEILENSGRQRSHLIVKDVPASTCRVKADHRWSVEGVESAGMSSFSGCTIRGCTTFTATHRDLSDLRPWKTSTGSVVSEFLSRNLQSLKQLTY